MVVYQEVMKRLARLGLAMMGLLCIAVAQPAGDAVAQGKQFTTAAVSWTPGNHIRVYISDGTNVTERGFDGSNWYTGAFKASGHAVSATAWMDNQTLKIRVYVTDGSKIVEHCWDGSGGWYIGGFTQ
jgi:Fungal fucose-specific lectin